MADTNINKQVKELEQLYLNGKFEELKSKLIKDRDSLSPGVFHYNLGTVLAKEGNLAAARYNLEKAKDLGFQHPALYKNISAVKKNVEVKSYAEVPLDVKVLEAFVFTPETVFILVSLCLALFVSLLYRFKVFKNKLVLVLCLFILSTPVLIKKYYYDTNYLTGINIKDTKIYEGPSEIYEPLKEVVGGQKVILGKSYEEWIFINWPVEYAGWVKRQDLGIF